MVFLIFLVVFFSHTSQANLKDLALQAKNMLLDIRTAKNCLPKKNGKYIVFCTGFKLGPTEVDFLAELSLPQCKKFISRSGYKVSYRRNETLLNKEEREQFFNSSKKAQIFHQKKVILFKKSVKKIDCVHEVLHLYQRIKGAKSKMGPIKRKERELLALEAIERQIKNVESYEKKGNMAEAKKLGNHLSSLLEVVKRWKDLVNWFDEKEIYYFLYKNCKDLNCDKEDLDIALTNLYRLRDFFSDKDKIWIEKDALTLLQSKINEVKNEIAILDFKPFLISNRSCSEKKIPCFEKNRSFSKDELCFLNRVYEKYPQMICDAYSSEKTLTDEFYREDLSRREFEKRILRARLVSQKLAKVFLNYQLKINKKLQNKELLKLLVAESYFVEKSPLETKINKGPLSYVLEEDYDLPIILKNGQKFIFDLGAENSVFFPTSFFKHHPKLKGVKSMPLVKLRTAGGEEKMAPRVKLKNGDVWLVADLKSSKFNGIDGIIGLDRFFDLDFVIDLKKKKVKTTSFSPLKPDSALWLRPKINALEVLCPSGFIFRIDSGSQVFGDMSLRLKKELREKLKNNEEIHCESLKIKGQFREDLQNDIIFNRGVTLNLGWPWLKKFEKIKISRKNNWIILK